MSQNDENSIDKYIENNYITAEGVVLLLCAGPAECIFLDIFRRNNPGLSFITRDDIRALSHDYYMRNGNNLQQTLSFIQGELKKYYKVIFDIWICFKFTIIERIPDGTTDPQVIQNIITDYFPGQLIILLSYLFDSIFYNTIIRRFAPESKKGMIQKNVVDIVLLYSNLYIFLQHPDPSLPFFTFNNRNISLTLLLNVMVYKYFDSLHKISSIMFENYIYFLNEMFKILISIFGNTSSEQNKQKIDFGLGHVAHFLLYLPNLSEILQNDEINPKYVSLGLIREFEKKNIFFRRHSSGQIEKTLTLKEVLILKQPGNDVSEYDVERNIIFNPMSQNTLSHAIEFISAIRIKVNEKQRSSISEGDIQSTIEQLKKDYGVTALGYDYFSFLYFSADLVEKFISTNSQSKHNKIILRSDFSQCHIQVPQFEIYTEEEDRRMKIQEEKKQLQLQEEARENAERIKRFNEIKFRKEQQERRKAQPQAAASPPPAVAVVSLPKELTETEKEQLRIQRNTTFKTYIQSIFPEFSTAIQSRRYEEAASMLNEKLPPKLRANVPWTATNMEKFPPTVKKVYDELLLSSAAAAAEKAAAEKAAAEQAAAEQAAFNEFEKNIGLLCGGNGITYFETMFHCSLPQFFRIITVVRELPDQEIIKIMSSLVPAPDSASARTGPLTSYMDLENSGRNCRALFAFALLNGIRRVEHVRFSFIGRTFLQLIACHSMLPVEACETLHIPKNTSDIDVYVIFNPDKDPITLRPLFLHIFNLFWRIPPENIHIHYSRDNASWRQFEESGNGHLYESVTRGTPDVMKVSFNNQGKVVEVSDIGFKTVQQFAGVFRLSLPPLSRDKRFETLTVNELKLLELKYTLDQEIFSFNPQHNPCVVQLDLQFPSALSGFDESIDNVFKILNSFLNNQLNFGSNPHAPVDFYFILVSNLLKFIVRIIQYKGISEGGVNIQKLHANVNSGVRSLRVLQFERFKRSIEDAAIDLINLFFKADGSINDNIFRMVDEYRKTSESKESGAALRVESERLSAFHTHILETLRGYGFHSEYLDTSYQFGFNLYGGVKQKQQRNKYTKKNRMNKKKRYSRKINKIKKIKIKQNVKKSLKYHKTNHYKVTKKY